MVRLENGQRVEAEIFDFAGNSKFISIGWIIRVTSKEISIRTCTRANVGIPKPPEWEVIRVDMENPKNYVRRLS